MTLKTKDSKLFNLAGVHLHSKAGNNSRSQLRKNEPIVQKIRECEEFSKTDFTIIAGDFNQCPHEDDFRDMKMLPTERSRSLITKMLAGKNAKQRSEIWYNPMLHISDDTNSSEGKNVNEDMVVPGSYYYRENILSMNWKLFDGFIVRPSLMYKIIFKECAIITKTTETLLVDFANFLLRPSTNPINDMYSDHLPVILSINI